MSNESIFIAGVSGMFLGRFGQDPYALAAMVAEADSFTRQPQEVLR